ncbi:MAG: sulfite oxidase [Chloroflexota bacterium]|nr:sulfite oxidase [Chloroflexota bacterium]
MAESDRSVEGWIAASGLARESRRRQLWELARSRGMGRRMFLQLLSFGGAAAVIAACESGPQPRQNETATDVGAGRNEGWFKDPAPFIQHDGQNLEARLASLEGLITPAHQFFVRNNSHSLDLAESEWRLQVAGDAVSKQLELSYDQIRELPARKLTAYLECAGNHRAMFDLVNGRKAAGTQWMTGAIGNGEWAGTPLREVLSLAGVSDRAVSAQLVGLDLESPEQGFRYVLPMAKAMHPDTLLAYSLNGEPLPRDHGFPLRALVPGWVGAASVKWLGRIEVARRPIFGRTNTTSYVLIGDRFPANAPAQGEPVHAQVVKSALALPWPARLAAGQTRLRGFAQSPMGPIERVQWSPDSGANWFEAELTDSQPDYSWARFEFYWNATPGEHSIMTRATDAAGNFQPAEVPFNAKGYLFNQPLPHPVRVT